MHTLQLHSFLQISFDPRQDYYGESIRTMYNMNVFKDYSLHISLKNVYRNILIFHKTNFAVNFVPLILGEKKKVSKDGTMNIPMNSL